ncbi:MAG: lipoprotein [Burkholderiales bacterium]|jgi:predicted small lipoprotein YifL|nr:lipoprotein [Burkholderiales bacterium]
MTSIFRVRALCFMALMSLLAFSLLGCGIKGPLSPPKKQETAHQTQTFSYDVFERDSFLGYESFAKHPLSPHRLLSCLTEAA